MNPVAELSNEVPLEMAKDEEIVASLAMEYPPSHALAFLLRLIRR